MFVPFTIRPLSVTSNPPDSCTVSGCAHWQEASASGFCYTVVTGLVSVIAGASFAPGESRKGTVSCCVQL